MSAPVGLEAELGSENVRPTATWRVPSQITELVEHSPLETIYLRAFSWFFLIAGMGYYFLIARRWEMPGPALSSHVEVFVMIGVAQLSLVFLYTRLSNKIDLGPGLRRLRTKVPAEQACPVAVEIVQDHVVTGCDEGFMWINEGTLYFKGLQTVFRLNAADLPPIGLWPRKWRPSIDLGRPPRNLPVPVGDRLVRIKLKLIDPFEDHGARRRSAAFDRALTTWLVERPKGTLESLLPPLELHDSLRHTSLFRFEGLVAGILLSIVNLTILGTARRDFSSEGTMAMTNATEFASGLLLAALSARLVLSQWRDLAVRHRLALTLPKPF